MYYVLGVDNGQVIALTSKVFPTYEAAKAYADTCWQGWRPFVVKLVAE